MQTKYRQPLRKTQGCVVWVAWFVCCFMGYQCKASIDSIWGEHSLVAWFLENTGLCGFGCLVCWLLGGLPMQSKYRQHLGKTFGCLVCLLLVGYPPFLFRLVGVLVGSACLACCLLDGLHLCRCHHRQLQAGVSKPQQWFSALRPRTARLAKAGIPCPPPSRTAPFVQKNLPPPNAIMN